MLKIIPFSLSNLLKLVRLQHLLLVSSLIFSDKNAEIFKTTGELALKFDTVSEELKEFIHE